MDNKSSKTTKKSSSNEYNQVNEEDLLLKKVNLKVILAVVDI